ncbi:helix-turn-helix domain-containing protein [Paenibacillus oceani]|uniref:Helix-turn-helix domain-containing protein n=1 Tax=Paenibacillus oceani TaxID=2772510 RepID=A0A927GYI4_9BACL|nr:helix-turn-helix domain-containing protein [Paenibacillus oceani]MBD2861635.1 helix-turn-helix domain-containing protein [Paenibacillus oceani]
MNNLPEYLSVKQVAELLGWHPNTVYFRCTSGELPSFKSGNIRRIRKEAYLQWIAKLEQESVAQ